MILEETLAELENHRAAKDKTNGMTWERELLDILLRVAIVVVKELIRLQSISGGKQ